MPRTIAVVIHDVAPKTLPACRRLLDEISTLADLPVTLLVVPRYHGAPPDRQFERWLDAAVTRGDELALHGFTHRDDGQPQGWLDQLRRRWYTAGEGEFAALGVREASMRLRAGRLWFSANGWPLEGFVAPAWLMSKGTRQALMSQRFRYTATLSRVIRLPSQREMHAQSIVYSTRTAWRRALSPVWNAAVAGVQRNASLLRFELHPPDVDHPGVRASWTRLLSAALEGRQALTMAQFAQRQPDALWRAPSR